jgi:septal ring factor EnvC (AmiA/AmiB activator)
VRPLVALLVAAALGGPLPAGAAGAADAPAAAAPTVEAASAAAGARVEAATAALAASPDAPAAVAALVDALVAQEAALAALRDAARSAEARERTLTLDLARRRPEITQLLAAMQALSRSPGPDPALHPDGPLAGARAALMLRHITPALQEEADQLAVQLREIAAARDLRKTGLGAIDAGLARLAAGREALGASLARRAAAPTGLGLAARQAPADVAREADTLGALARGLAALGRAAPAAPEPLPLRWPVAGEVRSGFDAPDGAGVRRPGLLLAAAPLALVVAPADGLVRYAGPFLDYGYVVALEPRPDVLIVLAGLATLEARDGARVRAGELLGLLGGRPIGSQEFLMLADAGNDETPTETLYIELWHGAGAVDPAPWFNG